MCNVSIAFMPRISSNVSGDSITPLIGQTENGYLKMLDFMPWENVPITGPAASVTKKLQNVRRPKYHDDLMLLDEA
jgi:hypothetical protein